MGAIQWIGLPFSSLWLLTEAESLVSSILTTIAGLFSNFQLSMVLILDL